MRINLCVNGTFRYPQYVRHYADAGVLNAFYYAHRRSTDAARLGLGSTPCRNGWIKEAALQAAFRWAPRLLDHGLTLPLCDVWQSGVIRHWRACDTVEGVVGAVADRVFAHAKACGSKVVGHAVTAHPASVAAEVGRAYRDLGLDPAGARPTGARRREEELALCDRLLVDSAYVARSYRAAGIPSARIVRIIPGVDAARFAPRDAAERDRGTFRVVCVGTLTPRKAQHVLLGAWRRLRLPKAELVLVGARGRQSTAVVRGFEDTFTHHAHIPNAALRALLVRASVFVLPSIEDGFPQASFEALSCGVPVIVTANAGTADLIEEGVNGHVVPAFDAEAIATHLEALYRCPERTEAMGEAAAATARRLGGWRAYVAQVVDVHRALVAGAPGAMEAA